MKPLKLHIKDKHTAQLHRLSGSVNFVCNYVNDLRLQYLKRNWHTNHPKAKRESLGWLPFKHSAIKYLATHQTGNCISKSKRLKTTLQLSVTKEQKFILELWDSDNLSLYQINTCEIVQDSRNR